MHKIIITENQLQILQEASMSINDVYNKHYKDIDRNIFDNIINIDPFSIKTGNTKIGKGAQWLLKFIGKGIQFDFNKAKEALLAYKTALENKDAVELFSKNIMDYKSVDDLYNNVKPLINNVEKPKVFRNRLEEVEYAKRDVHQTREIYSNNDWLFVQVLSQNSEIGWGLNTRWCTAYDEELNNKYWDKSHYKSYAEHNNRKLYVLANKHNSNEKYQLCPETDEFKDSNDIDVEDYDSFPLDILENIYVNTNFKSIGSALYTKKLGVDYVYDFKNGFTKVKLNNKFNFINENGKLISSQWFDGAGDFENGFANVKLDNKWNFINTNGELISNKLFDSVGYFDNGFAGVELDNKYNFINTNGEIISSKWFDSIGYFGNGFAVVYLRDKGWNFINTNGELISKQWFDNVRYFENDFAIVELDNKFNFINTNCELISKQWFDNVRDFENDFAKVNLNNKWNIINTNGELISNKLFDYVGYFDNGFAAVKLDNKYNFINSNGKLLSKQWFDNVSNFKNGFAKVELNNNTYYIDTKANLYDYDKNFIKNLNTNNNIKENNKKEIMGKIRLTENQLHKVIKESVKRILKKVLNEGENNQPNYFYYAVSKINHKIINAWEKEDSDKEMMKRDLIDNDVDIRNVKILTLPFLMRNGIDPNDDENWSNTVDE